MRRNLRHLLVGETVCFSEGFWLGVWSLFAGFNRWSEGAEGFASFSMFLIVDEIGDRKEDE